MEGHETGMEMLKVPDRGEQGSQTSYKRYSAWKGFTARVEKSAEAKAGEATAAKQNSQLGASGKGYSSRTHWFNAIYGAGAWSCT